MRGEADAGTINRLSDENKRLDVRNQALEAKVAEMSTRLDAALDRIDALEAEAATFRRDTEQLLIANNITPPPWFPRQPVNPL